MLHHYEAGQYSGIKPDALHGNDSSRKVLSADGLLPSEGRWAQIQVHPAGRVAVDSHRRRIKKS